MSLLDIEYINTLKQYDSKQDAKSELAKYAEEFNITLKKTKSLDNMIIDFKTELDKLKSVPMPDNNSGLSTRDLCKLKNDDYNLDNENLLEEKEVLEDQPSEEQLLIDSPTQEAQLKVIDLPETYSPALHILGHGNNTYATIPWWIYEWIVENPNWKEIPEKFPHYYGIDTLYGLIYYIKRDGYVRIRETKNSQFFILE